MPSGAAAVLRTALRLGLSSFGGPIAHLGYFERTYVRQLGWLSGAEYASLIALCQALPGPTSSQLGFLIGLRHAGWRGALAAWLGFTAPSALALYACALLTARMQGPLALALLHGLKLTAVAVVAQALLNLARTLCPDLPRVAVALAATAALLILAGPYQQLLVLAGGAAAGMLVCRGSAAAATLAPRLPVRREVAWCAAALFGLLLVALPLAAGDARHGYAALVALFYRSGALVFGGGHVVLPLLRDALVPAGWLSDDDFLTGYGLAQAVPGPLFTVAAYLGERAATPVPALAAALAVIFIFLPGLLLATAGAALWGALVRHAALRAAIAGVNAAVVGLVAAALYQPLWTTAVRDGVDVAIVAAGFLVLMARAPPLAVVLLCSGCSALRLLAAG